MIEELPSPRLACRFTHEIVRRALYDRLSRLRRAELHLRVGEALESAGAASDRALADLAHHFGAAAPFGGAERAIDYNLRAARAASAALAFDDAAMRLRTAIEIGIEGERERADALLELGSASHRAGKATDALEAFASAAAIARELGSGELLARAAIGYEDACWRPGVAAGTRSSCSKRRSPRSATRARSCGSACWPGSPARSTSRASASAARSCAKTRSRWRGATTTARRSRRCWFAPTGRAARPRWRRSSRC